MSLNRRAILLMTGLTIALGGEQVAAQKAPPAAGAVKIVDLGSATTPIYGFDFSASGVADYSGGTGGGKATFSAIGITRTFDAVSVDLFEAIATGRRFKRVEIVIFKPGSTTVDSTYVLTDVAVTSLKAAPGTEFVAFAYAQIDVTSAGTSFCFNVVSNVPC